jgi:tRNA-Thr(GGU) m(6)t(6)A37 methyltransferase TsaA
MIAAGGDFMLQPIGVVESSLRDPSAAPRQADEGGPPATIRLYPEFTSAAAEIQVGDEIFLLTWLHLADRTVRSVRPRDDPNRPLRGVFSTRSQDRPNPIGLHRVRVIARSLGAIEVDAIEAIDGTPVLDIKPVLGDAGSR